MPEDAIILHGSEFFLSGFNCGAYRMSNVFITGVERSFMRGYRDVFCDNSGTPVARAIYPASVDLTLKLTGFPQEISEPDRKTMLQKLCDGMSVRELFGVINGKLKERAA